MGGKSAAHGKIEPSEVKMSTIIGKGISTHNFYLFFDNLKCLGQRS